MSEEHINENSDLQIEDNRMDDLNRFIWERHGLSFDLDDPISVTWTIHEYFLEKFTQEQSRLFGVQLQSFVDALTSGSSELEKGVNTALRSLQDEVLQGYVRDNLAKITEQTKLVDKQASISSEIVKQFRTHRKTLLIITATNIGGLLLTILLWLSIWLS